MLEGERELSLGCEREQIWCVCERERERANIVRERERERGERREGVYLWEKEISKDKET